MAAPPVCAGQPLRSGARSCQRAIIAMICHGGAIGPSRRTRAAEAIPSTDTASASAEPARTIAGSIGSNLWAEMVPWTRSHSARALTRRIQPRTVSAGTPRSAPIVRWPWPKALAPARRGYVIDVVGHALLASAFGQGHRTIGADLGVPADTVRGWIRRVRARAEWLRVQGTISAHKFDPMLPAIVLAGSALADAVSVLGMASAALVRRLGPIAPPWQIIAMIARWQLLAPLRSG